MNIEKKYLPLIFSVDFVLCVILSAVLGSMIITGNVYTPVSFDLGSLSLLTLPQFLCSALYSSVIQLVLIFLAGFSTLSVYVAYAVLAYRGLAFGYTCSMLSAGSLVLADGISKHLSALKLAPSVIVIALYLISSAAVAVMAYISVDRSVACIGRDCQNKTTWFRYYSSFAVVSGTVFVCDLIKQAVIYSL